MPCRLSICHADCPYAMPIVHMPCRLSICHADCPYVMPIFEHVAHMFNMSHRYYTCHTNLLHVTLIFSIAAWIFIWYAELCVCLFTCHAKCFTCHHIFFMSHASFPNAFNCLYATPILLYDSHTQDFVKHNTVCHNRHLSQPTFCGGVAAEIMHSHWNIPIC